MTKTFSKNINNKELIKKLLIINDPLERIMNKLFNN